MAPATNYGGGSEVLITLTTPRVDDDEDNVVGGSGSGSGDASLEENTSSTTTSMLTPRKFTKVFHRTTTASYTTPPTQSIPGEEEGASSSDDIILPFIIVALVGLVVLTVLVAAVVIILRRRKKARLERSARWSQASGANITIQNGHNPKGSGSKSFNNNHQKKATDSPAPNYGDVYVGNAGMQNEQSETPTQAVQNNEYCEAISPQITSSEPPPLYDSLEFEKQNGTSQPQSETADKDKAATNTYETVQS